MALAAAIGQLIAMLAARAVSALVLCAAATLAVPPHAARAQEVPYQNHMVGERSLGLAGAFVGVADDPSAIFHNPGGTAALDTSGAAGSLWALARGSRDVENGYRTDLGSANLDFSQSLSLPLFLAGVIKFGPRAEDGVRPHALGAALFRPLDRQYRFVDQLEDPVAVDRIEVRRNDNARWLALSYGYRLRPGLALGLSASWVTRTFRHDEVEIKARETQPADSMVGSLVSTASTLQIDAQYLMLRIGTLLHITRELQAGLMFQFPGIQLTGAGEAEQLDARVGPQPTQITIAHDRDLDVAFPTPFELRAGVTALHDVDSLLTLDLSFFGPSGTERDPVRLIEQDSAKLGAYVPHTIYRRASLRAALGFETLISDVVPLRGGIFYERSAIPQLASRTSAYGVDRIDYMGAAFSAGIRTGGYDLSVGATAILGWGEGFALVRSADNAAPPSYAVTDVNETMLMVFIGGARSAVRTLVKTLIDD